MKSVWIETGFRHGLIYMTPSPHLINMADATITNPSSKDRTALIYKSDSFL